VDGCAQLSVQLLVPSLRDSVPFIGLTPDLRPGLHYAARSGLELGGDGVRLCLGARRRGIYFTVESTRWIRNQNPHSSRKERD